jgi:serine/threonine protein kinase
MATYRSDSTLPAQREGADRLAGTRIGHYEIVAILGTGGMGMVFKAWDLRLSRWVALKFLSSRLRRDVIAQECLASEARIASALHHRNICTIHDFDSTDDGDRFIVMAYCDGQTLKRLLEAGALTARQAVTFAVQIADALAYLHGRGVVHGDVKPANVMVTAHGLKLLDFGLATAPSSPRCALRGSPTPGTAAYMAPEQARGHQGDARSDLWALGVVLFEMLTGRVPFNGPYAEAVSYAIRHDPLPRMRGTGTHISTALERFVCRLLAKNPKNRYPTAPALACELRTILSTATASEESGRRLRHDWHDNFPLPSHVTVGYRRDGHRV